MRRPQHPIQLDAALPFWRSAFIEVERTHSGLAINRRIHFYGGDGSSVHTLHLASSSSVAVFEEILEAFVHPDQPAEPLVDEMPFARSAVSASDGHALSLSRTAIVEIFYYVARNEIPVTVSVMNAGCTQTHCGLFQRVRNAHGVLQVTGCGAEVCFREASIAWGRLITGSEEVKLFDARGREVAWIAPSRRAGPHKACRWREILLQWAHPVGSMTSGGHKMSDLALLSDAGRAEERRT